MFKDIEWIKVFVFLLLIFWIGWTMFILIEAIRNRQPEHSVDMKRKIKICQNYSNDFWRSDIDFIDGKCYYKGKEVEVK